MLQNDKNYQTILTDESGITLQNFVMGPIIAKGCSAAVYAAQFVNSMQNENNLMDIEVETKDTSAFPLAMKMMFNYDTESNAAAILNAMYRETVPARKHQNDNLTVWEQKLAENKVMLPPHPNIVTMYYVFTDDIPILPGSWGMYPDALPSRINPHGSGRNMSLFLVMKRLVFNGTRYTFIFSQCLTHVVHYFRYDTTLKQYIASRNIDMRVSILLFAQLLEAVAHMNTYGIAHR